MSFSEKLKELRLQNNLTQEQLARKLDTTRRTYIYYETGKKYPSAALLNRVTQVFNVSTSFLIDEQDEEQAQESKRSSFSTKLKELRLQNNLSQEKLARKLDIATGTYLFYEKGKRYPPVKLLAQMAEILNVSISFLVDEQNEAQAQEGNLRKVETMQLVEEISGRLAGNELSETEKDAAMEALQEAYQKAKNK